MANKFVRTQASVAAIGLAFALAVSTSVGAEPSLFGSTPGVPAMPKEPECKSYTIRVLQYPTDTVRQSIWGQLCYRGHLSADMPVQVLVHGGAYNHTYWDSPYQPERYSYVYAATGRGYATLNFDRLGYGQSDHPNPATLDFNVASFITHQVVQTLRAGKFEGVPFSRVILNGHSMGAMAAENEAANYGDVDGLIVSGIGHVFNMTPDKAFIFSPASTDPKFMGRPELIGYLTTQANGRLGAFVAKGTYDPGIAAVEEGVLKDTLSPNELLALTNDTSDQSDVTRRIKVPVLFALGRYDQLWCSRTGDCETDPQAVNEASYWDPAVSFTKVLIPDAGHSINSNLSAPTFYATTFAWLQEHSLSPR